MILPVTLLVTTITNLYDLTIVIPMQHNGIMTQVMLISSKLLWPDDMIFLYQLSKDT